jgi:predicted Rossmann-fold nucleotide-binding protein
MSQHNIETGRRDIAQYPHYHEVETTEELYSLLQNSKHIYRYAFQNIDFTTLNIEKSDYCYEDCLFMGCIFTPQMRKQIDKSCLIFSHIDVPFNTFRNHLYTPETLYRGYQKGKPESYAKCYDSIIYHHYLHMGKTATDIKETLARTLHDHAISNALHDFLDHYHEKQVVGIMGGHGLLRTDSAYQKIVNLSKRLTELGYLLVTGGGPGAMEATHLGAWMAGRSQSEIEKAMAILKKAPSFKNQDWLDTAFEVRELFPQQQYISLGIPTWLYGHEPTTPFATHIAKYFENAIREDGILTIAKGGIIYSPGSAGTMQEIFQEAVQNHYLSFGYASPMIFLGHQYWTEEMPVFPLLQQLLNNGKYQNLLLTLSDQEEEIVSAIQSFFQP